MKLLNKIQQELKAPKWQRNNFWKYQYRSCEDILEAVKPLLWDGTLTLSDELIVWSVLEEEYIVINKNPTKVNTLRTYIKATATLKYWDEIETATAFARESSNKTWMDLSQLTGSTSSYARKYALNWLFAIDDTKDADSTNTHWKEEVKATPKPNWETTKKNIKESWELWICPKCWAKNKLSQAGKPYCGALCWKN